jgi:site-specific DNA-methyltransferase (adenine-specific)
LMNTQPTDELAGGDARLYRADCLDVLRAMPAGSVDAIVTDPPYGMSWNTDSTRFTGGQRDIERGDGRADWGSVRNDDKPFDPAPWLAFPKVVLWGANHYAAKLPVGTTLVWLKKADHLFGTFLSDAEIGWMKGGYGVYCHRKQFPPPSRMAEAGGQVAHPTQKPIDLMRWCIRRPNLPAGSVVFDPYMGSGTTGIAAVQEGMRFVGCEIDPTHFATAVRRLSHAVGVGSLFQSATGSNGA